MTENVLDKIKAYKLEEVAADKAAKPLVDVEAEAKAADPTRGFANALIEASKTGYGLITEVKKASPSKGLIRADFNPPLLAKAYEIFGVKPTLLERDFNIPPLPELLAELDTIKAIQAQALAAGSSALEQASTTQ